ncbi:NADP-dependent oxidoreductase [Tabrizicola sp.]|uniref:NADP-dependent oxidoreductase n=1 Tax=Tabrizicola sp. TaxID=2005166 RepID=UPI00286A5EF4|nr:NADP-dependent oxidoreductase [Tabrizicola sp.]
MKAARIHAYGASSEIRIEDAPLPTLQADDVLIRVVATSVNPVDWKIRKGYLKDFIPYEMPLIMGLDVSGIVEKTGPAVTRFKPGDAVYSRPDTRRNGAYAEYIAVRESEVVAKPTTISHVEAASLPLVSITAWEALFTTANLSAGQRVLIHAGAGGVGSIAVQLARAKGAHVTATASAGKMALVRSLGADEVIDYKSQDFSSVVSGMDVVFDTVGGDVTEKSWAVLNPGGMLVSITQQPSEDRAKAEGKRAGYVFIGPNAPILTELAKMVDLGQVRPIIAAEFGLNDAAKAQDFSEIGSATGKVVIYVGHP